MSVAALVAELQARGVTLRPEGEVLKVRPTSKVTPEELEMLRKNKAEVMGILTMPARQSPGSAPARPTPEMFTLWPSSLPGYGDRAVGALERCAMCRAATWVKYGNVAFCIMCTARPRLAERAIELRRLLCMAFDANAHGASPEVAVFLEQVLVGALDELGPTVGLGIARETAQAWFSEHRTCPWCGGPDFHEGGA